MHYEVDHDLSLTASRTASACSMIYYVRVTCVLVLRLGRKEEAVEINAAQYELKYGRCGSVET